MNSSSPIHNADQTLQHLKAIIDSLPLFKKLNDDFSDLEPYGNHYRKFKQVIILGTGGASLAGKTVVALQDSFSPQFYFQDNIDPYTFGTLFKKISIQETGVIAISKSGNTAETLMQLLVCLEHWKDTNKQDHFLIISEKGPNAIREIAHKFGLPILDHPHDIGGRFSAFTTVGILPGIIANINVKDFLQGANDVVSLLKSSSLQTCSPLIGALLKYGAYTQGINQSVFMTYCDRLLPLGNWYRQLWAESLGKKDENHQPHGMTPMIAKGATDQHSQLQLYLDGPKDKFFTILTLAQQYSLKALQTDDFHHPALTILHNKTMGDLIIAEQKSTFDTLKNHSCHVRELKIDTLDARTLGSLMMQFILETLAFAHLIKVNPFDQPAVEEGKKLALDYLKQNTIDDKF